MRRKRLILGISGASGVILGYRLAEALGDQDAEVHMVVSEAARRTWELETQLPFSALQKQADVLYDIGNLAARIASGSYLTDGMAVVPCSMKTLAGIVTGYTDNLLLRAADVCLKEGRKLVLCPREMPLGKIHLRNLCTAADLGCSIVPPMLTFYGGQSTARQQMDHVIGKIMMQFGMEYGEFRPWEGTDKR